MDIWDFLGIEPTGEIAAIKKAYARQLRKYHPEDDPEGFQQLREAYENALELAKEEPDFNVSDAMERDGVKRSVAEEFFEDNWKMSPLDGENKKTSAFSFQSPFPEKRSPELPDIPDLEVQFIHQVEQLYADFFARIDLKNWKALLDCDLMWNIEGRNKAGNDLLDFLAEHDHLPPDVWKFLDESFDWSQQEDRYDAQVPAELIAAIADRITGPYAPCYFAMKKIAGFDYERFLNCRQMALDSSLEDILREESGYYRTQVETVYPDDPQLPRFLGRFYFKTRDFNKAKECLEKTILAAPKDREALALLGQVTYKIKAGLGWSLLKKPWRTDLVKQYIAVAKEIKAQKKASRKPLSPERLDQKRRWAIFGSLLIIGLVVGAVAIMTTKTEASTADFFTFRIWRAVATLISCAIILAFRYSRKNKL